MTTSASFTDEHAVSFGKFYNSVNFTDVRDGLIEESDVHGWSFKLIIELTQFFFDEFFQLISLFERNFDINLSGLWLVKEIDKNGVIFIMVSALFDVRLKSGLELITDQFLKLKPIFDWNQSVMEDSHCFMYPKSENGQFGVTVELVENVNTLNDLTDISHVEHIVWLGRGG